MGVANRCYDWAPEGTIQLDGRGNVAYHCRKETFFQQLSCQQYVDVVFSPARAYWFRDKTARCARAGRRGGNTGKTQLR
jgi:hypothetical protein